VKGYKGFDKDFKCHDKQYEVGQAYEEQVAKLCECGIHFCEHPLDVFGYYPPDKSRYAEIKADEVSDEKGDDSKRVAKKITIKGELSISGFIKAAVAIVIEPLLKKATTGDGAHSATTGNDAHSATTGYGAHSATTGDGAHSATTGDGAHSATTGYGAHSEVKGANSVAVSLGIEGKAAGSLGCWITLAEWAMGKNDEWQIKCVKSAKVDGEKIKPETFYILKGGKFIEVFENKEE
jgi:hypothetical protein